MMREEPQPAIPRIPAHLLPHFDGAGRITGIDWPVARSVYAATGDGERLFLCDTFGHRIICADPAGRILWSVGTRGDGHGQFHYPRGILLHREHLLICDAWNHRVQVLDRQGRFLDPLVDMSPVQLYEPSDIIHDESVFFVADRRRHVVVVLDHAGRIARFLGGASAEGEKHSETVDDLVRLSCLRGKKTATPVRSSAHTLGRDEDGHIWSADTQHFYRFDLLGGRHTTLTLPHLLNTRALTIVGKTAIFFDDRSGDLVLLSLDCRRFCHISAGSEPWVASVALSGDGVELISTGSRIACSRRDLELIIEEHGAPVETIDGAESAHAERESFEISEKTVWIIGEARTLANRVRAASATIRDQPVCYSRMYAQQHAAMTLPPDVSLLCAGRDWLDESATPIAVEVADLLEEVGRFCSRIEGERTRPHLTTASDLHVDLISAAEQLQGVCSRMVEERLRTDSEAAGDELTRNEVAIRFIMVAQLQQAARTLADLCRPGRISPLTPAFSGWKPCLNQLRADMSEQLLVAVEQFWLDQSAVSEAPKEAALRRELAFAWWRYHHLRFSLDLPDGETLPPMPPRPDRSLLFWMDEAGLQSDFDTIRRIGSAQPGRTVKIPKGFLQLADALRRARGGENVAEEVRNICVNAGRKDPRREIEALLYLWPRIPPDLEEWFPVRRARNANLTHLTREDLEQAWSHRDGEKDADEYPLAAIPAAIALGLERDDVHTARKLSRRRLVIAPDVHSCCDHVYILRRCGELREADDLARELEEREEVRLSAGQILRQMAHWKDCAASIERQERLARACGGVSPELQAKYLAVLQQLGGAPEIDSLSQADSGLYPTPAGLQVLNLALVALGKHDIARTVLNNLVFRFGPSGDRFMLRLHNALLCEDRAEADSTIADCEQQLPDDAVLPFLRAYLSYDGGDAGETDELLGRIPGDSPYLFYGTVLRARRLAGQLRFAEAMQELDRAAAMQARNAEVTALSALISLDRGDVDAVVRHLGAARLSHVYHPVLSGVRGCLATYLGNPVLARRHLQIAFSGLSRHYLLPRFLVAWSGSLAGAPADNDDRQFVDWMRSRWGDSFLVECLEALNRGAEDASAALQRIEFLEPNDRIERAALSTVRALLAEKAERWDLAFNHSAPLVSPVAEMPFEMFLLRIRINLALGDREAARSILAPLIAHCGAHAEVRRLAADLDLM